MVSRVADLSVAIIYVAIDFDECHKKSELGNKSNFSKRKKIYVIKSNNNKEKSQRDKKITILAVKKMRMMNFDWPKIALMYV